MSYICEKCDKKFKEKRYLKQHKNRSIPCDKVHDCDKCGVAFTTAYNLRKHKNRKTPCVPTEVPVLDASNSENKCKFCGKTYSTAYNLNRHIRNCPMKDNPNAMIQMMEKMMKQQQDHYEGMIKAMQNKQPVRQTLNQTVNNVVNNNLYVNLTICSFGKEDLSIIDTNGVVKLLEGDIKDFMPKMIEYIHANPKHPEFHNVFYDPEREKAIVFAPDASGDNLTWRPAEFGKVSDELTKKIKEHIKPGSGPYFDLVMQNKDSETANKIISIAHELKYNTPEVLKGSKTVLTKVTKNKGFLEQVVICE